MSSLNLVISFFILVILISLSKESDDFKNMKDQSTLYNPVHVAASKLGYGYDSIQPYYVCEGKTSSNVMALNAWHYSCKQACSESQKKTHVNITRINWNYVGKEISTYKVLTNEVCYTSHENVWGYCSQSQTIKPVATLKDDKVNIPKEYFNSDKGMLGMTVIKNSKEAECSYLSDNTICSRDYIIHYRSGKLSKKSENDPLMLNIYGDGIRVAPDSGSLVENDAAWFWTPPSQQVEHECGWRYAEDTECKYTNTSDVLYCPDIGYQYNLREIKKEKVCGNVEVYDLSGPAPFQYKTQTDKKTKEQLATEASAGKGDPDINLIRGINEALNTIEESYCSSSCDLFTRTDSSKEDMVMDTPVGTWRMSKDEVSNSMKMVPCTPTSNWRIKNPTTMCHGKNHLLVEDALTGHTCSWDAERNYITVDDLCNVNDKEKADDLMSYRQKIADNKDFVISFWTGDMFISKPPYDKTTWERSNQTVDANPSWFSKVALKPDMLRTKDDLSSVLTMMVEDMKQDVMYNQTNKKTVRTLLFEEIASGAGDILSNICKGLMSLLGGVPKLIILVASICMIFWVMKLTITYWITSRLKESEYGRVRNVTFSTPEAQEREADMSFVPSAPKKRTSMRSRSKQLAEELQGTFI